MTTKSSSIPCEGTFSNLADCSSKLPLNANPTKISFVQLFPIKKRGKYKNAYLTFQPLNPYLNLTDKEKLSIISNAIDYLNVKDLDGANPEKGKPGKDKNDINKIQAKRNFLAENKILSLKLANDSSDDQVLKNYRNHFKTTAAKHIDAFSRFIGTPVDSQDKSKLSAEILDNPFFTSHFTESDKNCLAILASYEQEWVHQGYSRGELLKTIELAPGETVTLEYHYWDKSIIKTDNELSNELELKQSSTLTQRESKHLLDELTKNNQLNLKGNFGQNFKLQDSPISFNGGADGGINSQVTPTVSSSIDTVLENVVNISNDFKQNHRVRIEETRDTGREEKQIRVISNTNRCHTLQFNYFEILSNFCVTTRFIKFTPCLLVPYQLECDNKIITNNNIDYKFILCNEGLLKAALLDKVFIPGFEAAKKITSFKKLNSLVNEFHQNAVTTDQNGPSAGGSNPTSSLESRFGKFRDEILKDYDDIADSAEELTRFGKDLVTKARSLKNTINDLNDALNPIKSASRLTQLTLQLNGNLIEAANVQANEILDLKDEVIDKTDKLQKFISGFLLDFFASDGRKGNRLLYFIGLSLNNDAIQALNKLKSTRNSISAEQAMETFVRSGLTENDFQFVNPINGQISEFFASFGVPDAAADFLAQIIGYVVLGVAVEVIGVAVGGVIGTLIEPGVGTAIGAVVGAIIGIEIGVVTAIAGSSIELLKDDAGLHNDVQAALSFFKDAKTTSTGAIPVTGVTGGSQPSTGVNQRSVADFVSLSVIADAEVELERLICHIGCNFEHYKQVLWLGMDSDARSRFLIKNKLDGVVANEVVGFYNGMVAFKLLNLDIFKGVFDTALVADQLKDATSKFKDASSLITIPTSSTTLSGQLGECDLCEPYIQDSRAADVRQQNAKAALDEAEVNYKNSRTAISNQEALRIQDRIAAGDLSDPIEHANGKIDISLTTQDNNP